MHTLHPNAYDINNGYMRKVRFYLRYATLEQWPTDRVLRACVRRGALRARATAAGVQFCVPVTLGDIQRCHVAVPNALRTAAHGCTGPPHECTHVPIDAWLRHGMVHAFAQRHILPVDRDAFCSALLCA